MNKNSTLTGLYYLQQKLTILSWVTVFVTSLCLPAVVNAAEWSTTELQLQYGELDTPEFAGGGKADTTILTFQHASVWKYGDNFFFIDYLNDNQEGNGFNDTDFYGELYLNFSLGKISGATIGVGPIKDIGILAGLNFAGDANVRKYLPGVRLSWDIPEFDFLNTDFTAYLDDSSGVTSGGAPKEDDSYMFDVSWAYPFSIGEHSFSIEGHAEYIDERANEFGDTVESWVLLQPQFRYDLGKTLFKSDDQLFVGVEWQYWKNKLGDKKTDENAIQALLVWRL
jgi:nucleoside-specific outer membrane channel protein Tsx